MILEMKERKMTVTTAARHFADVVNRAYYRHESTLLVKNDVPVARIVPAVPGLCTGGELAEDWVNLPHLSVENAEALADELAESRGKVRPPKSPWQRGIRKRRG